MNTSKKEFIKLIILLWTTLILAVVLNMTYGCTEYIPGYIKLDSKEMGEYLGVFKVTAYTAGFESCGKLPDDPLYGVTASGKYVQENHTIAADWNVLPNGSTVRIEGRMYIYTVEDKGGAIKGSCIDIYMESLQSALNWGVQNKRVYLVKEEDEKMENCDVCGSSNLVQSHHAVNGYPDRKLSDKYNLMKFDLCYKCHHLGVHGKNINLKYLLKRIAQENFEENYGTNLMFMKIFKRNYIELYKQKVDDEFYYKSINEGIKRNQLKRLRR